MSLLFFLFYVTAGVKKYFVYKVHSSKNHLILLNFISLSEELEMALHVNVWNSEK